MIPRLPTAVLSMMLFTGIALTACDAPADESAPKEVQGSVAGQAATDEGVSSEEIPHSDVPPPSREVFADEDCDFEEWVGKTVDEAAIKETGRIHRIMTPDSMMTMDHNPERINVIHDDKKIVTRVWCG